MPGWWFTIESTTPAHLLAQFEAAIKEALASPLEVRARMRATSAKQRFPVMVWVKQLEKLQAGAKRFLRTGNGAPLADLQLPRPAYLSDGPPTPSIEDLSDVEYDGFRTPISDGARTPDMAAPGSFLTPPSRALIAGSPRDSICSSRLSLASVVGEKTDFCLLKVNASFTDADGSAARAFEQELSRIDANSGKVELCIEEYLMKCEKKWFNEARLKKLGMSSANTSRATVAMYTEGMVNESPPEDLLEDQGSEPPTGLKKFMLMKVGDWPLYSFFLAIVCSPIFSILSTLNIIRVKSSPQTPTKSPC
jgi:alpha-1,3-glucan synthase